MDPSARTISPRGENAAENFRRAPSVNFLRRAAAAALTIAAAALAYSNSFPGILTLDDHSAILENPSIRRLSSLTDVLRPPVEAGVAGRPLANLTFALNHAINGLNPWSYHATNVVLHALCALVLFGVVRRTLLQPPLRARYGALAHAVALTAALLWTVHPVTTAVVNYVSQRTEALMALCYLLTLYAFIRAAEFHLLSETSDRGKMRRWLAISVAACAAGMASKETMVTAPVLVLLYARTFVTGTFRAAWTSHRGYFIALGATWLLLGALMVGSRLAERGIGHGLGVTTFDYALTSCRSLLHYLRLSIWPSPLVFDYGWAYAKSVVSVLPHLVLCVALGLGTLVALLRRPALGFLAAAFLLILAPTTSIFPLIQQPIAESRVYLPLAALATLAVAALFALVRRRIAMIAAAGAIVSLALATLQRNEAYRTPVALWSDTIAKQPANARAHGNLAAALLAEGRHAESIAASEAALRLRPNYRDAHHNLATALLHTGRAGEAIAHFEAVLHLDPRFAAAHNNLSVALLQLGRGAEALEHATAAVRLNPKSADAHFNRGAALVATGQNAEAIRQFERALQFDPAYARAENNLGVLRLHAGDPAAALRHFEAALRIDPRYAEARRNLEAVRAKQPHAR